MSRKQTRKRANGDGSVFQLPDGSWRAVVSCGNIGGKRVRRTRKAATRDEAKRKLAELMGEVRGGIPAVSDLSVSEWLDEWLKSLEGLAENTTASYGYSVRNHLVPHLGAARLASLTAAQIDAGIRRIKAGRTRELAFVVLHAALKRATKKGLIPANPADSADRPRNKRKRIVPFTTDQANAILDATKNDRLRAVYLLTMTLGMRQAEVFGLRWQDIDFDAGTLTIRQQACDISGKVYFREPKTDAGTRTVKMTPTIANALRDRQAAAMKEGHAANPLVFTNERGKAILRSNFSNRHWKPLLKRLKIRHRGQHIARHTAASLMLGVGVPVHVVSQILGHSRASVTLDLYSHLMTHQSGEAMDAISSMLG